MVVVPKVEEPTLALLVNAVVVVAIVDVIVAKVEDVGLEDEVVVVLGNVVVTCVKVVNVVNMERDVLTKLVDVVLDIELVVLGKPLAPV